MEEKGNGLPEENIHQNEVKWENEQMLAEAITLISILARIPAGCFSSSHFPYHC